MIQTKTDRRPYERPRMRVVELNQRAMLLAGSGGFGSRGPYDPTDDNPFGG
jgi:hypothetical protein